MKAFPTLAILVFVVGCGSETSRSGVDPFKNVALQKNPGASGTASNPGNLAEARKGFQTKLVRREKANTPIDSPPANQFKSVQYEAPLGKQAAYLTPDPKDGKKHAAIVWITGGDCNTIDGSIWRPAPADNDQTAKAYRDAGIVMMFPSLRGGNQNPGFKEGFFGEIDDVLAAADFLSKVDYVDPTRIYLGGHSTGGTVALLASEMSPRFRAVFSFGPVDNVFGYGPDYAPYNTGDNREFELRDPIRWLEGIRSPTFVFEGAVDGNLDSLENMQRASKNPRVSFHPMIGFNHFSLMQPTNTLIARKILADTGETSNIAFAENELKQLSGGPRKGKR